MLLGERLSDVEAQEHSWWTLLGGFEAVCGVDTARGLPQRGAWCPLWAVRTGSLAFCTIGLVMSHLPLLIGEVCVSH